MITIKTMREVVDSMLPKSRLYTNQYMDNNCEISWLDHYVSFQVTNRTDDKYIKISCVKAMIALAKAISEHEKEILEDLEKDINERS